ncbi:MAG: phage Gp37/Gp68 family protein [Ancylobacter novellus]|uniref:Phage Gp37/Gp68 family protein n=1 Tax=Ancylobacter novellus TaxID=921 RepID=A0A2W5QRV6_ANCNO|nr:MAG: phage Gp37/Gp68 family protein [Ancylobacter novellus]
MADRTGIEWTDATWNPIVGCSVVSPGCTNCYAMRQASRIALMAAGAGQVSHYAGTTQPSKAGPVWTGRMKLAPESILTQPLRWRRPRKIFVNSMGDLFHEDVPDEWIDRVFAIMALTPQHTYQVLTKRSARMRAYMAGHESKIPYLGRMPLERVHLEAAAHMEGDGGYMDALKRAGNIYSLYLDAPWPLPNVWLGVSAEDQRRANERVPDLLATPAAVRFISGEPLLGLVDLTRIDIDGESEMDALNPSMWLDEIQRWRGSSDTWEEDFLDWFGLHEMPDGGKIHPTLDLVIVGGENGPRPMNPEWARALRDQCAAAGTAFFFKQWGSWAPGEWTFDLDDHLHFTPDDDAVPVKGLNLAGADARMIWSAQNRTPEGRGFLNVGKRAAGRRLDGVEHNAMPQVRS